MKNQSRPTAILVLGSLGLWLLCAIWVVPIVIETAYRGESWSFLNRMITGQGTHPVAEYLQDWHRMAAKLTIVGLLNGLGFWLVTLVINRPVLVQRIRILYGAVAILTLNTLVLLVILEVAAIGVLTIWSVFAKPTKPLVGEGQPREKVSYYSSQNWAERYWYEFRLSRTQQYRPYVGWRRAPFKGQTIEIDQNGVRVTPGADCSAKSYRVFAFGESTMWGTGSPNWGTIPAYLQKGLEKMRRGPVCVMNFGESAYVVAQDTIALQMQLRSGNVPDAVVFYSLSGDIGAAYESGRAGVHANLDAIAARFQGRREPDTFVDRLSNTSAYSLIDQLVGKLTITNPQQKEPTAKARTAFEMVMHGTKELDVTGLSRLVVQDYFESYKIVSALAQKYGFTYFFFMPPLVTLGNKPLTSEEQQMKHAMENDVAAYKLSTAVYHNIEREASKYQNLYSMVHVFDHYDSLIFIDAGHVTPIGNQLIAEKMLDSMHVSPRQP